MKAGGSAYPATHETVENNWHYVYQEGQAVFKAAVSNMADTSVEVMERNKLSPTTSPTWSRIRPICGSSTRPPTVWACRAKSA